MAYDGFGNRTANAMQSSACPAQETSLQTTMPYTQANQFNSGSYGYNQSGDPNAKPGYSYLYDGDGRVCAVESTLVPGMTQMTGYIYERDPR